MTRLHDWPLRFEALLKSRVSVPFAWGTNDCCTFAADVVIALTGADAMQDLRGTYSSEAEAEALIQALGGLPEALTRYLGEAVPAAYANTGDVALVLNEGQTVVAVCNGGPVLAPGPRGVAALSDPSILFVWKV